MMRQMAKAAAVVVAVVAVAVVAVAALAQTVKAGLASMVWRRTIWTAMPRAISMATTRATMPVRKPTRRLPRAPVNRSSTSTTTRARRRYRHAPSRNPTPRPQ